MSAPHAASFVARNPAPAVWRAFTLIELLVVIAIIGLLPSVVFAAVNSARAKARDTQRIAVVRELQKAVEMFYADHGRYPGYPGASYTNTGGSWYIRNPIDGDPAEALAQFISELSPYLSPLPTIPKGSSVVYIATDNSCRSVNTVSRLQYRTNGTDYKIAVWLETKSSCDLVRDDGGSSTCCNIFPDSKGRSWEAYEVFSSGARNWIPIY